MEKLLGWLEQEARGLSVMAWGCVAVALTLGWTVMIISNLHFLGMTPVMSKQMIPTFDTEYLTYLLYAALSEELWFRMLPLAIAVLWWGISPTVLLVAIWSSVAFGLLHGGPIHIFMQGMGGIIFSLLFLKCGGFQKKWIKAVCVTTVVHACCNLFLGLIHAAIGAKII